MCATVLYVLDVIAIGYNIKKLLYKTFCETEISGLFSFIRLVLSPSPLPLSVSFAFDLFFRSPLLLCLSLWIFGFLRCSVSSLIYHCVSVVLPHSFPFLSFAHLLYGSASTSTAPIHMKSTCHTMYFMWTNSCKRVYTLCAVLCIVLRHYHKISVCFFQYFVLCSIKLMWLFCVHVHLICSPSLSLFLSSFFLSTLYHPFVFFTSTCMRQCVLVILWSVSSVCFIQINIWVAGYIF